MMFAMKTFSDIKQYQYIYIVYFFLRNLKLIYISFKKIKSLFMKNSIAQGKKIHKLGFCFISTKSKVCMDLKDVFELFQLKV